MVRRAFLLGPLQLDVLIMLQDASLSNIEIARTLKMSPSTVHTTLKRLGEKGFVSSTWSHKTKVRGGRRKRFYAIEPLGREALAFTQKVFEKAH